MPDVLMPVRARSPVMMPGSAIGSTSTNEIALAAEEPVAVHGERRERSRARSAMSVATRPTLIDDSANAARMSASPHASENHFVVKPLAATPAPTLSLNA